MATQLRPFLTEIANAIRTKKGTTDTINAQNFATEITNLPTGGGDNPLQTLVTGRGEYGGNYLCSSYKGDNVDFLVGIDFSAVTSMSNMFNKCTNLTTIPQLDTSRVTIMERMFFECENLTTIPQLDTSRANNMRYMFYSCKNLTTIDITRFKPTNASDGSYFVNICYSLTKFIIRTMDTIPRFGTSMFTGCYHFLGTVSETYNPDGLKDGRIYVPDAQVDALKAATGWADYAEIIVPLSTLVE